MKEPSFKSTFPHPSIDTSKPNKINLKGSYLEGNNVFTPSTGAYTYLGDHLSSKVQSATTKTDHPFSHINSPIAANVNPFNTYINPTVKSHHKSTSESHYVQGKNPLDIYGPSGLNQFNISHYSSNHQNLPEIPSLSMLQTSQEPNFYISNKSGMDRHNLDSSLHFETGGETEQYRSLVVDGLTYNSIHSIGPSTPKIDNTPADLLSRIGSVKSHYTHGSNSEHLRGFGDPYSQWGAQNSRNSLDRGIGLTTPQFRNYVETGFSNQGSRNSLSNSGMHTPTDNLSYSLKNLNIDNSPLVCLSSFYCINYYNRRN